VEAENPEMRRNTKVHGLDQTGVPYKSGRREVGNYVRNRTGQTTFTTEELFHLSRLITMGQLSACFAHEVTNPLTLIRGHLRFIDETLSADHPLRANLEVIDRASQRIEDMSKNMLDFSKRKTRRSLPCDVGELLMEAVRFIEPYMRMSFVDVQLHV